MDIQWYPGHMTKTRRMIVENLKNVDLVVEVVDARIPISSRNPDIDAIVGEKPRLVVLNRVDQADPAQTKRWGEWFRSRGIPVLETDSKTGRGVNQFSPMVKSVLGDRIARWREKGQVGRPVRAMVVGIPNVGKSTLINKLAKRRSAKAEDRPGVTRGKQWVAVDAGLDLLDTPGILWPKFEDPAVGLKLAYTGAVKDEVTDAQTLASRLMETLASGYSGALQERYKITGEAGEPGWELLERAAKKRGFLISGGEPDLERMAKVLLDEFRGGKLGRFTLDGPEDVQSSEAGNEKA